MPSDRRGEHRVTIYRAEVPGSDEIWEAKYEAIADALHFACRDLREGRRRPLEIVEDGVVIYDQSSLPRACEEHARESRSDSRA